MWFDAFTNSEEDFERALGTYAKQNHSSTVFLDSSTGPVLTTPTSSAPSPPPSDVTRTSSARKLSVGDLSHGHTRGRTSSEGAAIVTSSVKRHESAVSAQSIENEKATKRNFHSNPVAPTCYSWLNEQAAEDDGIFTATAGRYSNNMLQSSDLALSSKMSLEKLTQSLQTVDRISSSDLGRRRGVKSRSSLSRPTPHKRSLSVQSLASTASSVDSGTTCTNTVYVYRLFILNLGIRISYMNVVAYTWYCNYKGIDLYSCINVCLSVAINFFS